MSEWWKQLYGESEGKENKGLFPASVEFTADLHSMGQYIQQGERHLLETVVRFDPEEQESTVPFDAARRRRAELLAGRTMDLSAPRPWTAPCWPTRRAACPTSSCAAGL